MRIYAIQKMDAAFKPRGEMNTHTGFLAMSTLALDGIP